MPTKRKRLSRAMVPGVSEVALHFLSEGLFPLPDDCEKERIDWKYFTSDEEKSRLLDQCKTTILAEWCRRYPKRRPKFWSPQSSEKSRRV